MSTLKVTPARSGRDTTEIVVSLAPDTLAVHADITAAIAHAAGVRRIRVDTRGIGVAVAEHLNYINVDNLFTVVEHPRGFAA